MLTGSSPVNGSSRTSSRGLATMAAMNWTFCAMPFDSASTLLVRPAGQLEAFQPVVDFRAAAAHAFQLGEEPQQLPHAHLPVQPPFLGQVADAVVGRRCPGRIPAR